jgi:hypothetical protein
MASAGLAPEALLKVRNANICLSTAVLSVLVVWWAVIRLRDRHWVPRSRLTVPLLAVAVTAVASGLQGALFYDSTVAGVHRYVLVQLYATALVVLSVAAAFLVAGQITQRDDLTAAIRVMIFVGVVILVAAFRPSYALRPPPWYPIPLTHVVTLVFAALLCGLPSRPWQWIAGVLFTACVLYGPAQSFLLAMHTQWISGWLMLGVPFVVMSVLRFPRAASVALVVTAAAAAYWVWPMVEHTFDVARREGDFIRVRIWQDALLMGMLRPFLGVGLGNYMDYAERYAQIDIALGSAHGNYQQIAAEMGMTGLGFVLWCLSRALGVAWRLFRTAADPLYRTLGLALCGGLAGQMAASVLGDYLLPAYHNAGHTTISSTLYTWMMVGVLMGVERLARETPSRQET